MRASFFLLLFLVAFSFFVSSLSLVQAVTCPEEGNWTIVSGVCVPADTGLSNQPVENILKNFMNWLLAILGFIGIIAFVISGMQYLLSAGDDNTITTAKRNMKYSIIGIAVALSGYIIIIAIDLALNAVADF